MKTYKGTDKDMKCRGYQYELGKQEEMSDEIKICDRGYHSCTDPLDVFAYYAPADSRYFKAEAEKVSGDRSWDSKVVSSKIRLMTEIGLKGIIEAGIKFRLGRIRVACDTQATGYQAGAQATGYQAGAQATGYQAGAQATGDQAGAQATGCQAVAQATGYKAGAQATGDMVMASVNGRFSNAQVDGHQSIACALGYKCTSKGTKNNYLVLAERGDWDGLCYPIIDIQAVKIDGEKIKENVNYALVNGKIIPIKEVYDEEQ